MRHPFLTLLTLLSCLLDLSSGPKLFAAQQIQNSSLIGDRSPRNDDFAQRRRITGAHVDARGTTRRATVELGEPYQSGTSVWFQWTAPRDGTFELSVLSDNTVRLLVLTGASLNTLTLITYTTETTFLRATRGTHYYLSVQDLNGTGADFTLKIRPVSAPPNDEFADAIAFTGTNVTIQGDISHATRDSGGPYYVLGYGNVWYRWTAQSDGLFLASTASESVFPSVYEGTNSLGLTAVGQTISGLKSGSAFYAVRDNTYWISADGYSAFASNFTLTVSAETPPPNDQFTNSTVVAGTEVSVIGSSMGATFVPGEPSYVFPRPPTPTPRPVPTPTPGPALPPSPSSSAPKAVWPVLSSPNGYVWYTWTAPTSGAYRISARLILPPPTGLGTPLRLADALVILSGNSLSELTQITSGYPDSGAILRATAGATYHVAVPQGRFSFELKIEPAPLPPNDDYSDATVLAGAFVSKTGSALNATPEPSHPYSDVAVWYRWTVPTNGFYAVTVLSDYHRLAIYRGGAFTNAQLLHYGDSRPVLRAQAGEEFHIEVIQNFSGSNTFTLKIEPVTPPANDDFANSEVLTGTSVDFTAQVQNATREEFEPGTASAAARDTVWFSWTAPEDGQYTVKFPTNVAFLRISTGTNFWMLQDFANNYRSFGDLPDAVFFGSRAGTTFNISVDDTYGHVSDIPVELRLLPRPANDNFADRIFLRGRNISVRGTLAGSTEDEEGPDYPYIYRQSIWYSWTAPGDGRARIDIPPSAPGNVVGLGSSRTVWPFTGNSLTNLDYVTGIYQGEFVVQAGVTYQLMVTGDSTVEPDDFELKLSWFKRPSNDNFGQRTRLVQRARGTTDGASLEDGEPIYDNDPIDKTVWWTWRAPRDGSYELTVTGSASLAQIFTGEQVDDLTPIPSSGPIGQRLHFRATAGTSYAIRVSHYNYGGGNFQLRIIRRDGPANDNFEDRFELSGTDIIVTGHNAFATPELNEPDHGADRARHSVWWKWIPPTNGTAFVQFDGTPVKRLAIYRGEHLEELAPIESGNGSFYFDVHAGEELQIAVDDAYASIFNAPDPWEFRLFLVPAPANDNFADRTPLSGTTVQVLGSFVGASLEPGEPLSYYASGHSVWWSWTAPETGSYTFRLATAWNIEPTLRLYSGDAVDALDAIAEVGNSYAVAEVNLPFMAGQQIVIRADGQFEAATDQFELTIRKVPPPPNDNFANRAELINGRGIGRYEGATAEAGEWGNYYPHFSSVWWQFTAISNGWHSIVARLTNSAGSVSTIYAIPLTGDNVTNLWNVQPSQSHRDLRYWLTAGTEYALQVSDDRVGTVGIEVRHMPSPSNDHFTNAMQLIGAHVSVPGSNAWASLEPSEPWNFNWPGDSSVWWRYVPAQSGVYLVTPVTSQFHMTVFTGTALSNLTNVPFVGYGAELPGYLFRANAGVEHYIRLMSGGISEGHFTLQLDQVQSPANDDFTNRIELVGQHISLNASNHFATPEPGDPLTNFLGQQTVWWSWVAPESGQVSLNFISTKPLRFGVFTGSTLTNLAAVPGAAPGSSPLNFNVQAGVEYQIGVTTYSYYAWEFTLILNMTPSAQLAAVQVQSSRAIVLTPRANQIIETSTDLVRWTPYRTNTLSAPNISIVPDPREPQRFFRVR